MQGSGWGWLGYNKATGALEIATTANQDPLSTTVSPVCVCVLGGVGLMGTEESVGWVDRS